MPSDDDAEFQNSLAALYSSERVLRSSSGVGHYRAAGESIVAGPSTGRLLVVLSRGGRSVHRVPSRRRKAAGICSASRMHSRHVDSALEGLQGLEEQRVESRDQ